MAKHTCDPSTWEAEEEEPSWFWRQPGLHSESLSQNKNNKNHTQFSKNPFAFIPAEIQKGWPHNRHCCFCLVAPKSLSSLSEEKQIELPMYTQGDGVPSTGYKVRLKRFSIFISTLPDPDKWNKPSFEKTLIQLILTGERTTGFKVKHFLVPDPALQHN